jgi:putative glutamine amidotransferase
MTLPLIGVTTSKSLDREGYPMITCMESYTRSVITAGGNPVLIPLGLHDDQINDLLLRLDGVLFTGGGDIHPERFGGKDHPKISEINEDRDQIEMELYQIAVHQETPFLGICRGLQLINVASGGSLYTHIADQHPGAMEHCYYPGWPRDYLPHSVKVEKNSRLMQITQQKEMQVNSLHHQGIDRLGEGYTATAYAPDGLIEAVELSGHPYGLAVQWHPECLQDHRSMRAIFESFIKAALQKNGGGGEING